MTLVMAAAAFLAKLAADLRRSALGKANERSSERFSRLSRIVALIPSVPEIRTLLARLLLPPCFAKNLRLRLVPLATKPSSPRRRSPRQATARTSNATVVLVRLAVSHPTGTTSFRCGAPLTGCPTDKVTVSAFVHQVSGRRLINSCDKNAQGEQFDMAKNAGILFARSAIVLANDSLVT